MNVVHMRRYVSRETVALLKGLLDLAERGEISGVTLCYRLSDGGEFAEVTGHYLRAPNDGLSAAMRMSWAMTRALERDMPGAP